MFKYVKTFSSFSADSLENVKPFYSKVLGIEIKESEMGILELHLANGQEVIIYPKPDHVPATFTVLNFEVENIESAVDELTKQGVQFEHYDMADLKTDEKGIMRDGGHSAAWFKDPAGNILSVMESK